MMMPAQPTPYLVMVQAQPPFALLEGRFDGPPHASNPDQRGHRGVDWRIAEIDLEFRLLPHGPPKDHPHVRAGQPSTDRHAALEGKFSYQRSFTALLDQVWVPRFCRQRCGKLIDALRGRLSRDQADFVRPSATARPRLHRRRWPCSQTRVSWGISAQYHRCKAATLSRKVVGQRLHRTSPSESVPGQSGSGPAASPGPRSAWS